MRLLLDTHAFVWWLLDDPNLSARVRMAIENANAEVLVSAVTAFELATKVRLGKFDAAQEIAHRYEEMMTASLFVALPVSQRHALAAGRMAGEHRDPFDRILASQAHIEGMPLATVDPAFRQFGIETMW